jgi:hypothetical protein
MLDIQILNPTSQMTFKHLLWLLSISVLFSCGKSTPKIDYTDWSHYGAVLAAHVAPGERNGVKLNLVDYAALRADPRFAAVVDLVQAWPLAQLATPQERLAFHVNPDRRHQFREPHSGPAGRIGNAGHSGDAGKLRDDHGIHSGGSRYDRAAGWRWADQYHQLERGRHHGLRVHGGLDLCGQRSLRAPHGAGAGDGG